MRHTRLLAGFGLAVLVSMLAAAAMAQPNPVALVIANANYPDADKPLPSVVGDADAIAAELQHLGFEVEVKTDLDKAETQRAIDAFIDKIKRGETALFYFSGFGLQVERQTYLIPVDASIWAEADVRRDGISVNALVAQVQRKGAGTKLIVIDAGRRNPFEQRFRAAAAGLAPFEMPVGTLTLYSTAIGKSGEEAESRGHGLFASALLRELKAADASVEQLFNRVRTEVSRASQGRQVPWVASSLVKEVSFDDAPAMPEPAPPKQPPAPAPKVAALPAPSGAAGTPSGGGMAQAGRWQTVVQVRGRRSVCVFDLQPDGRYRFSERCPAPYPGETGDADVKGGKYIMRAKSGRVERGTIEMVGHDKFIARSGGGRVVWTRVE
jgi:hypothetical protein